MKNTLIFKIASALKRGGKILGKETPQKNSTKKSWLDLRGSF